MLSSVHIQVSSHDLAEFRGLNGWTRSNPIISILFPREYIPTRWTSVASSPGGRACTCTCRWVPEVWVPEVWALVGGGSCRMPGCSDERRPAAAARLQTVTFSTLSRLQGVESWCRPKVFSLEERGSEREVGGIQGASSMADSSGEYLIAQIRR